MLYIYIDSSIFIFSHLQQLLNKSFEYLFLILLHVYFIYINKFITDFFQYNCMRENFTQRTWWKAKALTMYYKSMNIFRNSKNWLTIHLKVCIMTLYVVLPYVHVAIYSVDREHDFNCQHILHWEKSLKLIYTYTTSYNYHHQFRHAFFFFRCNYYMQPSKVKNTYVKCMHISE